MTRDDNVLLNDVYFNACNINPPLTPLTPITKLFASFDGIGVHSGVPTRTTPTLTPTTLKNIEQTFMEATNDAQVNLPYQAGFVPPPYPMEDHSQDRDASQESLSSTSNGSWHVSGSHGYTGDDLDSKSSASLDRSPTMPSVAGSTGSRGRQSTFGAALAKAGAGGGGGGSSNSSSLGVLGGSGGTPERRSGGGGGAGGSSRRNVGGRRPHKPSNLTPEEEEKRRIRRERNKQAAARCRRRREDHTNELVDETDMLEKRRQSLHQEIQALQQEKNDLEFLLESHRDHCRLRARLSPIELKIKTEPEEDTSHQPRKQQQELQEPVLAEAVQQEQHSSRAPPMKKLKIFNDLSDSLETPTPTTLLAPLAAISAGKASGGVTAGSASRISAVSGVRPHRPDSLDVKSAQFPMLSIRNDSLAAAAAAVGISTPSNGLFNFDSLMEGGTGLTPIAAPITFPPNRNPLELITPTSTEPSKLCSL